MKEYLAGKKSELAFFALAMTVTVLAHGLNMFNFPYYENDEGVYMSQAWSLVTQSKMAPYTYWYDHAPAGWFLIALWTLMTGGFFTFGFSVNSGRVLMLVLQVAGAGLLYLIGKRLTGNKWVGFVSAMVFSISPLGIYFHRRVLLDNIMTFWVLLALFLVFYNGSKLRSIILSGFVFGIAILSKENAIFFIPIFLYIIYARSHEKHRTFALVKWLSVAGLVTSLYFLYAIVKGEFFPSGTLLGGTQEHVSLLTTLKDQYSRQGGGIMDMNKSSFWQSMRIWVQSDPLIIYLGVGATIVNLLIGIKRFAARVSAMLSLSMILFLMRGGLVIEFYIIPLLPFLALNIAMTLWYAWEVCKRVLGGLWNDRIAAIVRISVVIVYTFACLTYAVRVRGNLNLFMSDQTTPQVQAVDWMLSQNTPQAFYVIDNYGYIDLQTRNKGNFKNAEWYWKVDKDPEIGGKILGHNSANIDYIALTPQMEHDVPTAGLNMTLTAWHNSKPIVRFWNDGWGVEVWATNYSTRILQASWQSYKVHFIDDGRVLDPYQDNSTTSEGQSYAMLRAVWVDDKEAFDQVWNWTKSNLQQQEGLFSWKWGGGVLGKVLDTGTAADADEDIALALLFASKKWKGATYLQEGLKVMNGIWDQEVVMINGVPFMAAANWADKDGQVVINPSYLSPASYRIFAEADKEHPWIELVASSYSALNMCTKANLDKDRGMLPPEWCSLDKTSGEARQPDEFSPRGSEYAYNAFRVPWRIALDQQWFGSEEAKNYLNSLEVLSAKYLEEGKLNAAYQHDGSNWENYESVAAYGGNLGYFVVANPQLAGKIYQDKLLSKYYENGTTSYWDDPRNYYSQNWAWFGTALINKQTPNLFAQK